MTPGQLATPVVPVPVPQAAQVGELLQTLTGGAVEVAPGPPVLPGREPALVAVYVTDDTVTGAVVACELSLAAHAGAALGAVPVTEAEQALASGVLSADLSENADEVLNVLAAAFNTPGAPALRLYRVYAVGEPLPAEIGRVLGYVMRRVDLQLHIVGYGGGRLSVVAVG
ncbi:MAG: hypothetical protein WD794_11820 [Mycobacteriales bacterium]